MKKYCKYCKIQVTEHALFCPVCGKEVEEYNLNKRFAFSRKLFLLLSLMLIIIFAGIGFYIWFSSISESSKALEQNSNVGLSLSTQAVNGKDKNLGNLSENIFFGGFVVSNESQSSFIESDGIYVFDGDECRQIQQGNFSYLNMINEKIYCIDKDANCICTIDNNYEQIYKINNNEKLSNLVYVNNYLYFTSKGSDITFYQLSLNSHEVTYSTKFSANEVSIYPSLSNLKLFLINGNNWSVKEASLSNSNTINFTDKFSGFNNVLAAAFIDSNVLVFENKSDKAYLYSSTGGRREITLKDDKTGSVFVSDHTVFVYSKNNKLYWFNDEIGNCHNIEDAVGSSNLNSVNFGITKSNLWILENNECAKVYDFSSNDAYEVKQ